MPSQITSVDAPQQCVKYPEEQIGYAMEFSKLLVPAQNPNPAETIASILSVTFAPTGTSSDPVITGQTIVGSQVQMLIAGGAAGTIYRVIVLVQTSLGYKREGKGRLAVIN